VTRVVLRWIPALLWAAAIYVVSAQSSVSIPSFRSSDKVLHFCAYALLGFLLAHAVSSSGLSPRWAVALGWLYGASDEFHQSFVPGRSADPADWAADALGVLAGTFVYTRIQAWWRGRAPAAPAPGTDR